MMSQMWIRMVLAVAMQTLVVVATRNFWEDNSNICGNLKQRMAANQAVSRVYEVVDCITDCFSRTTNRLYTITPDQCFSDLVVPYITKVLKIEIPTDDEMQTCLNAKDRTRCKDKLLYYFAKWYKDNYSADHNKRFALFLFNTWAYIPDISRGNPSASWHAHVGEALKYLNYNSDQEIQAAIKVTSPSDPLKYPVIHRELKRYCYKPIKANDYDAKVFCRLRILMSIAAKINTLAKGKRKYNQNFQKYVRAVKTNFITFSVIFNTRYTGTKEQNILSLDQELNELITLTRAGSTEKLHTFLQFMPEPYLLEKACKKTLFPTLVRRFCILEKVVEQLLLYSNMVQKRKKNNNRKVVTINFSLNLRSVITELRGEEVFKMIVDNRYQQVSNQEAAASLIEGKFGQLKNYFSKLQSFNMQKASADVGYVKGRIKYYEAKTRKAINDVSTQVGGILRAALITQGLELGEKVIKLTFAIVEACNPFKAVFNGGTATDIMDALAEVMQAIARLAEGIALKSAWTEVITTVRTINTGFQKNSEFLSAVGRIVAKVRINNFPNDDEFEQCKSTFLRLYNAYSPKVDKQMLSVLATKIETTVTSGCALIDAATGSASNAYVASVKSNLYCQKAAASTTSLKTIFEEIYDFQFEFIENMASYLRSATGYQASQQMIMLSKKPVRQTGNANQRRSELRANVILAHVTYEIQKQGVIESLCDFLEYNEGGQTPEVCKGSTIDIPTLLSYIPMRCKSVRTYVSIPITTSTNGSPGHIDIKKLYSGEEVSFDIPSYNWMKRYKWIGEDESFKAIYIRNFEIFLPTINRGNKKVEVTVRSMGGDRFQDGGTKYTLIPPESFTIVYTGGNRYFPCSGDKIENPYNICEDRKLPNLCVMSGISDSDRRKILYPTAFARFKIKAHGIRSSHAPVPQTPLDIKAKVDMCIFKSEETGRKKSSVRPKSGCCSGNNYWNEARKVCQPCVSNSRSNLNGYYCEKNRLAMSSRKK